MHTAIGTLSLVFAACLLTVLGLAQPVVLPSGHWEGAIQVPDKELGIEVDLAKASSGSWIGQITIPAQGLKSFPLANVVVQGSSVSFGMKGIPGDPEFKGSLLGDGKSISGVFTQGPASLTFKLTRTGDPRMEPAAKSTAVTKEMQGTWEGTVEVQGKVLRLVVKLSNQPDGTATGSMTSVDQGGVEIPITTITQKASNLKLEVKTINGVYSGDLNQDGTQIAGKWTQGTVTLPLTFQRPEKN